MAAEQPRQPDPRRFDWTSSSARLIAVVLLASLGGAGLAWSVLRGPITPGRQPAPQVARPQTPETTPPGVMLFDSYTGALSSTASSEAPSADDSASAPGQAPPFFGPPAPGPDTEPPGADQPPQPEPPPATTSDPLPYPDELSAPASLAQTININTADEASLQLLPAIGPARARAIVQDRAANGPFRSIDDLDRVQGIGPSIIEGLRRFARVN